MQPWVGRAAAKLRPVVEEALDASVVDALFDGYVETGSVAGASRVVAEWAGVAVPYDVALFWWIEAKALDPTLAGDAIEAYGLEREERVLGEEALAAERVGLLHEIALVRAGLAGSHCPVCGAPVVPRTPDQTSCGPTCAALWVDCRYQISETYWASHQRINARCRLRHKPGDPWATRVLAGEPGMNYGRWTNSPTVRLALLSVMDRRATARRRWGDLAASLPPPPALDDQPFIGTATYSA